MIAIEVGLWIILTIIVVGTPLYLFSKKYIPIIRSGLCVTWKEAVKSIPNDLTESVDLLGKKIETNKKEDLSSIQETQKFLEKSSHENTTESSRYTGDTTGESEESIENNDKELVYEEIEIEIETEEIETENIEQVDPIENIIELAKKLSEQGDADQESTEDDEVSQDTALLEDKKPSNIDILTQKEIKHKQLERIKYAALTYKERGKIDLFEKKLIEGLALEPQHEEFLDLLSSLYFKQGNEVKALSLLKRVITMHPDNHKSIWQVGQIYRQQGKIDSARLLIEKAISIKSDNPKYLISLVEIHYENKEVKEAIQVMEKLSKIRPTNVDYLLTLATLHEEIQEPTKAYKYFMKVLEIEPLNEHAKKGVKRLGN